MKRRRTASLVIASAALVVVGVTLGALAQDRFALKAPNGISFGEFKGYEQWQMIASAVADNAAGCGSSPEPGCIKSIVGNAVAIKAYEAGIPANGQPVPDGAMLAKIEWYKRHVVEAYGVTIPGQFTEVAFMVKDSKRFPQTDGWGYATLKYDAATDTFKAFAGEAPDFHKTACHGCHTIVKSRDFLFTKYQKR